LILLIGPVLIATATRGQDLSTGLFALSQPSYARYSYDDEDNPAFTSPVRGVPAALDSSEATKFQQVVNQINHVIRQRPCHDLLTQRLWPSVIMDLSRALATHRAFSGPRSYNIRVMDSGIFPEGEVTRIREAARSKDPVLARAAQYEMNRTVAQLFEDRNGRHGRSLYAVVANYRGNPNSAFYQKINAVTTLHEMLHIITGLGDDDLAKRLGINTREFNHDYELSSTAITEILRKRGCE